MIQQYLKGLSEELLTFQPYQAQMNGTYQTRMQHTHMNGSVWNAMLSACILTGLERRY